MAAHYDEIRAEDVQGPYTVGDEINLSVSVEHFCVNVTGIRLHFVHDHDEGITITYTGDLRPASNGLGDEGAQPDHAASRNTRHSEASIVFPVTLEHVPGYYNLSFAEIDTASGRTLRYEGGSLHVRGDFRFLIVEEDADINVIDLRFEEWGPTDVTHHDATTE